MTAANVAGALEAGAAKVDITNTAARPVNDPLFVKALVLRHAETTAVIITVDAVAIAEIGSIRNEYLANVRTQLAISPGVAPENILLNASHCHGSVCADVEARTVRAVRQAWETMVPVKAGVGTGREARIMANRRLLLKNGRTADVRHAYAVPPDADLAEVGPVDPEIGILRLDRESGGTLAVVYNFACHPIQGVPNAANTADVSGFASQMIEDVLGNGAVAFFLQGCAGDINPVRYKDVDSPRDAEPLGHRLGLSTLQALRGIRAAASGPLRFVRDVLELPRADLAPAIAALRAEQAQLLASLHGTTLNLKTFLQLVVKYRLAGDFPSTHAHEYLHEQHLGRDAWIALDAQNRARLAEYTQNVLTMEQLTRVRTNLALLEMHQAQNEAAGRTTLTAELVGLRVGGFVLVAFPGELSVEIGLGIKKRSPHARTFVAGVSNGYIYYAPTAAQLANRGWAQEDSDCLLAPEWQALFEEKVRVLLERL